MANPPSVVVLIGPLGRGGAIAQDFYRGCPREGIAPDVLRITAVDSFSTLEELIDKMLAQTDCVFVIVNHGNTQDGLPETEHSQYPAADLRGRHVAARAE